MADEDVYYGVRVIQDSHLFKRVGHVINGNLKKKYKAFYCPVDREISFKSFTEGISIPVMSLKSLTGKLLEGDTMALFECKEPVNMSLYKGAMGFNIIKRISIDENKDILLRVMGLMFGKKDYSWLWLKYLSGHIPVSAFEQFIELEPLRVIRHAFFDINKEQRAILMREWPSCFQYTLNA